MRVVIEISYIGTNYCGWQIQDGKPTIQQVIQDKIKMLTNESVKVYASGRTDSGVHAYKQVAHFDTNSKIKPENFAYALNVILPFDIKIIKSYQVNENFNARFDVKKKIYSYKFYISRVALPFDCERAYQIPFKVNKQKLIDCAKLFIGTYDFTSFCKVGKEEKDRVRTIYDCVLKDIGNNHYEIDICGNGFLHNMVRIIVGTIIDVALGKIDIETVKNLLENKSFSRGKAGRTLPPYGLYLKDVKYE